MGRRAASAGPQRLNRSVWAHAKKLDGGELLFSEGDEAELFFVRTVGRVRLAQLTPEGDQVVLRLIAPARGRIQNCRECASFRRRPLPRSRDALRRVRHRTVRDDRRSLRDLSRSVDRLLLDVDRALARPRVSCEPT